MAAIGIEGVTKEFSGGVVAVDDVTLEIADGEFLVLVGPSGCGKTTLLRMIAGLEEVTDGSILIGGKDVTDAAPRHRDIAMVFQSYALYPHMTVRQNMAYGLKVRRTAKRETRERVERSPICSGYRVPRPQAGGALRRPAAARRDGPCDRARAAGVSDGRATSNLDAKLRVGMRASLSQLHERLGTTTVYVTHDQVEAMTLGQRVAVMRNGRIVQVDRPQRLYERPRDLYVAAFIGSPAMNLVEATLDGDEVAFGGFRFPLDPRRRPLRGSSEVVLGIRPECFEDAEFAPAGLPTLERKIEVVEELGSDAHVFFTVDAPPVDGGAARGRRGGPGRPAPQRAGAVHRARRRRGRAPVGRRPAPRDRSRALPLLRPADRREPHHRERAGAGGRRAMSRPPTKTAQTRERVLDMINAPRAWRGDPLRAAAQLGLGVSRLTVRAALDDLVREGHLSRRRGAGTFVTEPKIAQELTMTSFTDDMRRRGLAPASRTLELKIVPAGARLGRILHVSPGEPIVAAKRLRLADNETMAIEELHVRRRSSAASPAATSSSTRSTPCCASATAS